MVVTTLGSNSALGPSQKLAMNFAMRWWVAAGVPVLVGVLPLNELAWNNERWYRFIRGLEFLLLWIAVGCIFCGGLQFMLAI